MAPRSDVCMLSECVGAGVTVRHQAETRGREWVRDETRGRGRRQGELEGHHALL